MKWADVMDQVAEHYATLARIPGWRAYAKAQVQAMEADELGQWAGLLERVRQKLVQQLPQPPEPRS